jgi:hypothetical protein
MSRADFVLELLDIWGRGIKLAEKNGCEEGVAALKVAVNILVNTYDSSDICQALSEGMPLN